MRDLTAQVWRQLGGAASAVDQLAPVAPATGDPLPSSFAVAEIAAAAFGVLGLAAAEWAALGGQSVVRVDPDAACTAVRSEQALRVDGAGPRPLWDPLSTIFPAADGWVRLHGNYPEHRAAIERVLGSADPAQVAARIAQQPADAIEAALHRGGGVAAAARTLADWQQHPHGATVLDSPLVATAVRDDRRSGEGEAAARRPRVLELTRVIAGPAAGRALAWFGADVLRVEAPAHEELESLAIDLGAGKRSTQLDLRVPADRLTFLDLLAEADVFLHGLRPGALERLGLGAEVRAAVSPGLIDVSLSAYGATGGWAGRRGFDSLMQLSAGLAIAEALAAGDGGRPGAQATPGALPQPRPLPCQLLDHVTGLLLAAATLRALAGRRVDARGRSVSGSLARTAALVAEHGGRPLAPDAAPSPAPAGSVELHGAWGTTLHAPVAVSVDGLAAGWTQPPPRPGGDAATWRST